MRARDATLHSEPRISDMLDDPVIQALMRRDHVARADILDLVVSVRERLDISTVAERAAAA